MAYCQGDDGDAGCDGSRSIEGPEDGVYSRLWRAIRPQSSQTASHEIPRQVHPPVTHIEIGLPLFSLTSLLFRGGGCGIIHKKSY